jgi:hypothetical protein
LSLDVPDAASHVVDAGNHVVDAASHVVDAANHSIVIPLNVYTCIRKNYYEMTALLPQRLVSIAYLPIRQRKQNTCSFNAMNFGQIAHGSLSMSSLFPGLIFCTMRKLVFHKDNVGSVPVLHLAVEVIHHGA